MMPELDISVRGMKPVSFGGGEPEKQWWEELATKAQLVRASQPLPAITAPARFTVEMVFFLREAYGNKLEGSDLDNLAKPVLDTLFKGRKQPPTGILFDLDDAFVAKLIMEKRLAATQEEEGVDIIVAWR